MQQPVNTYFNQRPTGFVNQANPSRPPATPAIQVPNPWQPNLQSAQYPSQQTVNNYQDLSMQNQQRADMMMNQVINAKIQCGRLPQYLAPNVANYVRTEMMNGAVLQDLRRLFGNRMATDQEIWSYLDSHLTQVIDTIQRNTPQPAAPYNPWGAQPQYPQAAMCPPQQFGYGQQNYMQQQYAQNAYMQQQQMMQPHNPWGAQQQQQYNPYAQQTASQYDIARERSAYANKPAPTATATPTRTSAPQVARASAPATPVQAPAKKPEAPKEPVILRSMTAELPNEEISNIISEVFTKLGFNVEHVDGNELITRSVKAEEADYIDVTRVVNANVKLNDTCDSINDKMFEVREKFAVPEQECAISVSSCEKKYIEGDAEELKKSFDAVQKIIESFKKPFDKYEVGDIASVIDAIRKQGKTFVSKVEPIIMDNVKQAWDLASNKFGNGKTIALNIDPKFDEIDDLIFAGEVKYPEWGLDDIKFNKILLQAIKYGLLSMFRQGKVNCGIDEPEKEGDPKKFYILDEKVGCLLNLPLEATTKDHGATDYEVKRYKDDGRSSSLKRLIRDNGILLVKTDNRRKSPMIMYALSYDNELVSQRVNM